MPVWKWKPKSCFQYSQLFTQGFICNICGVTLMLLLSWQNNEATFFFFFFYQSVKSLDHTSAHLLQLAHGWKFLTSIQVTLYVFIYLSIYFLLISKWLLWKFYFVNFIVDVVIKTLNLANSERIIYHPLLYWCLDYSQVCHCITLWNVSPLHFCLLLFPDPYRHYSIQNGSLCDVLLLYIKKPKRWCPWEIMASISSYLFTVNCNFQFSKWVSTVRQQFYKNASVKVLRA